MGNHHFEPSISVGWKYLKNIFFFQWLVDDEGVRFQFRSDEVTPLITSVFAIEAQATSKTREPKLTFTKGTLNYVFIGVFASLSRTPNNGGFGFGAMTATCCMNQDQVID